MCMFMFSELYQFQHNLLLEMHFYPIPTAVKCDYLLHRVTDTLVSRLLELFLITDRKQQLFEMLQTQIHYFF